MALNNGYRPFTIAENFQFGVTFTKYREWRKEKIKMQLTTYENPCTARSTSKETKRHVRFLVCTDSVRLG
ncbi:hypothetical protein T11_9227 [Trichinella zimbabwensis]|uniref:Uncharacterized protein n=1 Tax=Trichinella zimbabwensis TaxID=268475 RepID=A0A0V1HQG8_9BILA|nr:hypothetical protein T11_9227 [Trichinella zimbabwensis]